MSDSLETVSTDTRNISSEFFRVFGEDKVDLLFHMERKDINTHHKGSNSENDNHQEHAQEDRMIRYTQHHKKCPSKKRFLYPSIGLIKSMEMISKIDVVEGKKIE